MAEFKYKVRTNQGEFIITLDQEVPETEAGQQMLQDLVTAQYATERDGLRTIAQQSFGGVRDAAQGWVDTPANILNAVTEFYNPMAPHPSRQRVIPEVRAPQLPQVPPPVGESEQWLRTGTNVATNVAAGMLSPTVRATLSRLIFGRAPGVPMMFEPNRAVGRSLAGRPPVATVAAPVGQLAEEFSEAGGNMARILGIEDMAAIRNMSLDQTLKARQRVWHLVQNDVGLAADGPLGEVMQALENRLLNFK
jgi:hypothetical protein